MLKEVVTVLVEGDGSGNDMLLKFHFPSGLDIFGLPTRNHYGGYWDLGPTWNYLVLADVPFLVDSGRFNQTDDILGMMEKVGFNPSDLEFILLSHGHEDHDGGAAALAEKTGAVIRAHPVYERIIRIDPDACPEGANPKFPAKCWNCFMPEEFTSRNCLDYHKANSSMIIDTVDEDPCELAPNVTSYWTPGHSPDCLSTMIGDEAIIVGDAVLPDITPWPTTLKLYRRLAGVLNGWEAERIMGLQAFIRSLHRLKRIGMKNRSLAVLPAHRLYYKGAWNDLDLVTRVDELLEHHINRCGDVLGALKDGPLTTEEVALRIFPEHLLKGPGKRMASYEVLSHLELMDATGDAEAGDHDRFSAIGTNRFEGFIRNLTTG